MADQTIDKVQVEIQASAKGTSAVFDQLERNLEMLQKAINSIDTSKLQNVQKATNGTRVGVNTSGMQKAEKDVSASVAKIQQSLAGLNAYANAAMGGDKSAFHSYERGAMRLQSNIDVLKEKFAQLGNTNIPTEAFSKLDQQIANTKSQLDSLEKKRQEMKDKGKDLGPSGMNMKEYIELNTQINKIKATFDELKAKQDALVNSGKAFTDPFEPYKRSLTEVEKRLGETTQAVQTAVDAMSQSPGANVDNSGLTETKNKAIDARAALKKLYDGTIGKTLSALKSALKKIGSAITGIGKKTDGVFGKGFMKILKYGFGIRSLYVLFRRLRKAVTESFKELQNSGAFYEETKANIDALKQSLTVLKYQFGAAFEPIFNAVAPALKVLVDNLIKVMNVISAFMSKLVGRSTYSKAVLNAAAFADNTGKAAKAQKELNKQLQGFDELNNLTTNKSNPGSGSSGSNDDIPGATYVEEQVDSVLGDFGKELAEKIRSGDWKGVGQAISDKLSEAMEKINWDAVYQKAKDFGSGLANFLNGLINPRLFGNVASTLAGALNTALYFLNSFGTTFDWKNFGNSIAQGINNFLKTFDFAELGKTIHTWLAGLLDAAIELLENTDFELLGEKLGDFIANLDLKDLAKKLGKLALLIIKALGEALIGLLSNKDAMEGLGAALLVVLGAVSLKGLLGVIGASIAGALSGQTIAVAASGTTIALTGLTFTLSGLALYEASKAGNSIEHNPLDFDKETGVSDWTNTFKEMVWGSAGLAGLAATPSVLSSVATKGIGGLLTGFASGFAKAFPTTAAIAIGGTGGSMIGNKLFEMAFPDSPEAQKYADEYRGVGSPFHPVKNYKAAKEIAEGAKSGDLKKAWYRYDILGLRDFGDTFVNNAAYALDFDSTENNLRDRINAFPHALELVVSSAEKLTKKTAVDITKWGIDQVSTWKDVSEYSGSFLDFLTKNAKKAIKANPTIKAASQKINYMNGIGDSFMNLFWTAAGSSGSEVPDNYLLSGDSILGAFNSLTEAADKSNTSMAGFTNQVNSAFTAIKGMTAETTVLGQTSATTTASVEKSFSMIPGIVSNAVKDVTNNVDKGFNGMPSTVTKYANQSWQGLTNAFSKSGEWSNKTSSTISKGFNGMPSAVESKFKSAYDKGTTAWNGIDAWANGVTTRTSTGMNGMPTEVQKRFLDAYNQGTSKWNGLDSWAQKGANTVSTAFNTFSTATSRQFGDAYNQGTSKWNNLPSWASKIFMTVSSASQTNLEKIPGQFSTSFGNGTAQAQSKLSAFSTWMSGLNLVKKAGVEADESSFSSFRSKINSFMSEIRNNKKVSISVEGTGFSSIISNFNTLISKINQIKSSSSSVGLGLTTGIRSFRLMASGGVVGGATPAIVGEAGPEAVIPLTDGTIGKLASMIVGDMAVPDAPIMAGTTEYRGYGNDQSDIAEQNALLREEVMLLRQIANKELTVSSKDVFNATRSESENYYNRTGNSPFLF